MLSKKESLDKQISWALENVPALAIYDSDAVAKIVKRVNDKMEGLRVALSLGFSLLTAFVSTALHDDLRAAGASEFERYSVTIAAVILGALLGTMIGKNIYLRRLEREVNGF